jgi:hypothetical protein
VILTKKIAIAVPVYRRLAEIKARLRAERGRDATYSEVLELLLANWDAASMMGRDSK